MKILFIHQNFPGQFPHLAPALAGRGHQVLALTDEKNERPSPVTTLRYKTPDPVAVNGLGHLRRAAITPPTTPCTACASLRISLRMQH